MTISNQDDHRSPQLTDYRRDGMWTLDTVSYVLWFEYLVLSPSYELARRDRVGELTKEDRNNLPSDFDKVQAVFDDFGDIRGQSFLEWWRKKGMSLCATGGDRPDVSLLAGIEHLEDELPDPSTTIAEYIEGKWVNEGSQKTILVAIPLGLSKSRINKRIGSILSQFPDSEKELEIRPPKYKLAGKRKNIEMLIRYWSVLSVRAGNPKLELWRIGALTALSNSYSPMLDYKAKRSQHGSTDDRKMLTILTSRAFKRGLLISENAARGTFPSYADCPHAVKPNLAEMHKRIESIIR